MAAGVSPSPNGDPEPGLGRTPQDWTFWPMRPRKTRPLPAGPGRQSGRRQNPGPSLRSSPRSFLGRGPPGHAAGLSTSRRNLWVRRECEAAPRLPGRQLSCWLRACLIHFHWRGRRQTLKRTVHRWKGGRDGHMVFLPLPHTLSHSRPFSCALPSSSLPTGASPHSP